MPPDSSSPEARETPADWEAIARYLADESAPHEAESVRAWLASHPADAELVRALDSSIDRAVAAVGAPAAGPIDVERALAAVAARRDAEPGARRDDERTARRNGTGVLPLAPRAGRASAAPGWRGAALRAAAAVLVVAGGVIVWRARSAEDEGGAPAVARSYITGVGQRDSVHLPDGSRVMLGPKSRLVVAAAYGEPARDVTLEGEGWFDVVHDDAHAFTVRAGSATIRDVGTTFTVRTDDASRVRVAVSAGAVLLASANGPADRGVVLHPGDVGTLDGARAEVERGIATSDDEAWTRGRLVFREAPIDRVRDELARWYGLELRVADSALARRHLTASFEGDSADAVLRVLGLALGARVERHGDTVVVRAADGGR